MRSFDPVKDYYKLLGVERQASAQQIKSAYHARAKIRHPDLGGSVAAMREINEAYEVLSDRATRMAYDNERRSTGVERAPDLTPAPPYKAESLGIPRPDEDLLWLTTRAILCAILAGLWLLAGEEAGLHRANSLLIPWVMRGLGFATLAVGIFLGYWAHKLAQQKMSRKLLLRPERGLRTCRALFRAVIAAFLAYALTIYLSNR